MKKRFFFLPLLLCLALIAPLALAKAAYIPGERAKALLADAWNAGQMIGGQLRVSFELADAFLPDADDTEVQAQLDALTEFLNGASIAGGLGKIDNGYRLELGASYTAPSNENVYITGALNLTGEGISAETNMLEGELVSIQWKTVLEMLGLSDDEIAMALSLQNIDWTSEMAALTDELNVLAERIGKLAEPYLPTLSDFVSTLDIQQRQDVAAENNYPAVDHELSITCTAQDFARLIRALADQMENDPELLPYIEQFITNNANMAITDDEEDTEEHDVVTAADFFADMRLFADQLDQSSNSVGLLIGYSDDNVPFYLTCAGFDDDGFAALLFQINPGETENTTLFTLSLAESDDDNVDTPLDAALTLTRDPDDQNVYNAALNLQIGGDKLDFTLDSAAMTTEDGLPGYTTTFAADVPVQTETDTLRIIYAGEGTNSLTVLDGEQGTFTMNIDFYENDILDLNLKNDVFQLIEPDNGALSGRLVLNETMTYESNPFSFGLDAALSSWDYDVTETAALDETVFETATGEELAALQNRFSLGLQQKLFSLLSLVPSELLDMLSE